jgi:hypothetical protein
LHVWVTVTAEGWSIAAMVGVGRCSSAKSSVCARRTGWGLALLDEGVEQLALVIAQRHNIFLWHGSVLSEGEFTPENRSNASL